MGSDAAFTLPAPAPHDQSRLLLFLGLHAVPGIESWDGVAYTRSLRLGHGPVVARIQPGDGGFAVRASVSDPEDLPALRTALAHLLDADPGTDPGPAQRHLAADPALAPLLAARPGLRAPGSADHFETLVRTVIGQQISIRAASTVTGHLVARAGDRLPRPVDGVTHVFPEARTLASLDPETLSMPRARGRSLVALSGAIAAGLDPWGSSDPAGMLAAFAGLPGVGPWTASYLALRVARDPDVMLASDIGVRRQLEHLGLAASAVEVRRRAAGWAAHRSTALMHLWHALLERRHAPVPEPPPSRI